MRMALPSLVAPSLQDLAKVEVLVVSVPVVEAPAMGGSHAEPWVDTLAVSTTSPAAFHA